MSAKTEQLLMRKESLQASYKAKELALKEQIQNTLLDLQKYRAIVQSKQATIKASMGAKNIIEARYKEGLATYIEVLDANTQHLNAKIGLEVNKFSIAEALYRLDYIQGKSE
jgi:outer membrane protein TolC